MQVAQYLSRVSSVPLLELRQGEELVRPLMQEYPLPGSADVAFVLLAMLEVELFDGLPLWAHQVIIVIPVA